MMDFHHIIMLIHHKLYDSYKLYYCPAGQWTHLPPLPYSSHLLPPLHPQDAGVDQRSLVAINFPPLLLCGVAHRKSGVAHCKASFGSVSQLMGGHLADGLLISADRLIQLVEATVVNRSPCRT